jgi:hypothetical protein
MIANPNYQNADACILITDDADLVAERHYRNADAWISVAEDTYQTADL